MIRARDNCWNNTDDDEEKPVTISFRLEQGALDAFDRICGKERMSRSYALRRMVMAYIEDYRREDRGG